MALDTNLINKTMKYMMQDYKSKTNIQSLKTYFKDEPKTVKNCIIRSFSTKNLCTSYKFCDLIKYSIDRNVNTNKEFPNFFQMIYHAGSVEQFLDAVNASLKEFKMYKPILGDIMDTFNYIFNVLKKGIFVVIKDSVLKVFLPFSNANYRNDYEITITPELLRKIKTTKTDDNFELEANPNVNEWYANYNIFRNTRYKRGPLKGLPDEGARSVENILELLVETCYYKDVPDVYFFVNTRDFPIIRKDNTHPYPLLYTTTRKVTPIKIPVFSQSTSPLYNDLLLPTDDDIYNTLCPQESKYNTNWSTKKNVAVFRGAATGSGITELTNDRIKLYKIAEKHNQLKKTPIMDVQLTSFNDKLKFVVENGIRKLAVIDTRELVKGTWLKPEVQSNYKYIIHVQGFVASYRLTRELSYNSLIIKIKNPWTLWLDEFLYGYDPLLESEVQRYSDSAPSVRHSQSALDKETEPLAELQKSFKKCHYITCTLDNLETVLTWCLDNDYKCKAIANNAFRFWQLLQSKEYMLNYTYNILKSLSPLQTSESFKAYLKEYYSVNQETGFLNGALPRINSTVYFVSAGDNSLKKSLERIGIDAKPYFKNIIIYNVSNVFDKQYSKYTLKPAVLLETLDKIKYNDFIVYADPGCYFSNTDALESYFVNGYDSIAFQTPNIEKTWTKMDLIKFINTDDINYGQYHSKFFIIRKTDNIIKMITLWLHICKIDFLMSDEYFFPNDPTFIQHKNEQSAWSLIRKKFKNSFVCSQTENEPMSTMPKY